MIFNQPTELPQYKSLVGRAQQLQSLALILKFHGGEGGGKLSQNSMEGREGGS